MNFSDLIPVIVMVLYSVQAAAMHEIQTLAKQRSDDMVPQVLRLLPLSP